MTPAQIGLLGFIAGATIFISLPVGRLRAVGASARAFLSSVAVGILLFLFWDVLTAAAEPIEDALKAAADGTRPATDFALLAGVAAAGLGVSLLGLVAYERWVAGRRAGRDAPVPETVGARVESGVAAARDLALLIAVGIGLHNFAEGLAIGQSAASGELALAGTLVVGFALHNATEGFGIVAPMTGQGVAPSWRYLAVLGLIGGGPTFVGTLVGQAWVSTTVSVAFLALAAGSILYVVIELLNLNRAPALRLAGAVGILAGLLLGFGTDFILGALGG